MIATPSVFDDRDVLITFKGDHGGYRFLGHVEGVHGALVVAYGRSITPAGRPLHPSLAVLYYSDMESIETVEHFLATPAGRVAVKRAIRLELIEAFGSAIAERIEVR